MTTVRISETYDLSTQVNKMGIIGIHTPNFNELKALYPGLCQNHRYFRVVNCDVTLACASMLPADPLQIGTETGSIAPQDMFNPILYTAVSNDSFNTLQNRIYANLSPVTSLGQSIKDATFPDTLENIDWFNVYYSLLASPDGFRKAMPQAGLEMKGLYPIVYQVLNSYGNARLPDGAGDLGGVVAVQDDGTPLVESGRAYTFRGDSVRMPRLPLHVWMNDQTDPTIPQTYVALIITPPAKLNRLYYRMKVTWTFEFSEVIPITEYADLETMADRGGSLYASDYVTQSSKMDHTANSVDSSNTELEQIMTSAR